MFGPCWCFSGVWFLVFGVIALPSHGATLPPFALLATNTSLIGAHRVVFLGDSITYSGQYVDDVEAVLRADGLMGETEFLDLGLPSETVSGLSESGHAGGKFPRPDLHERLGRVLAKTRPDLVIACYGMNDGIYYPFGEERFQKFRDGILWLHVTVSVAGARIVHVTPPTFDPVPVKDHTLPAGLQEYRQPYEGYNEVLDRYSAWLLSQRTNGWQVVDVHSAMNDYLARRRKEAPGFVLARDGVHVDDTGHWIIAKQLLRGLDAIPLGSKIDLERFQDLAGGKLGTTLLKSIHEKNRLLSDAWLTDIGHKRPGMTQGLPIGDARVKAAGLVLRINEMARQFALQLQAANTNAAAPAGRRP